MDGSLNLLGLETVRLIYFRNKMAGKTLCRSGATGKKKAAELMKRSRCSRDVMKISLLPSNGVSELVVRSISSAFPL